MSVPASLLRIFKTRKLKEETIQAELRAAILKLSCLKDGFQSSVLRARRGRSLLDKSIFEWDVEDWVTGLEEIRSASNAVRILADAIAAMEAKAASIQAELLSVRLEKEQAFKLLEAATAAENRRLVKREQQELDEWHRNRFHREHPSGSEGSVAETDVSARLKHRI